MVRRSLGVWWSLRYPILDTPQPPTPAAPSLPPQTDLRRSAG